MRGKVVECSLTYILQLRTYGRVSLAAQLPDCLLLLIELSDGDVDVDGNDDYDDGRHETTIIVCYLFSRASTWFVVCTRFVFVRGTRACARFACV